MMRILALLAGVVMAGTAPAADTLGRFFFTPDERANLDLARTQKKLPQVKAEESVAAPAPQMLTYSGIVRRSDGKSVLWLNNKPVDEKQALSNLAVSGHVRDGAVTVQVPTGRRIDLKVGQSVELTSGTVAEGAGRASPTPPRKAAADAEQPATQAPAAADAAPARKETRPVK